MGRVSAVLPNRDGFFELGKRGGSPLPSGGPSEEESSVSDAQSQAAQIGRQYRQEQTQFTHRTALVALGGDIELHYVFDLVAVEVTHQITVRLHSGPRDVFH